MLKTQKYDNVSFWYDNKNQIRFYQKKDIPTYLKNSPQIEYWDSVLEFTVYQHLLKLVDKSLILRQQVINIIPKNNLFKDWTWNVDFVINYPNPVYLEVKGKWIINHPKMDSFWHTLKVCQLFKPEVFDQLLLVGREDEWLIPKTKIKVHPYKKLKDELKSFF
jgi:hypothetical protein